MEGTVESDRAALPGSGSRSPPSPAGLDAAGAPDAELFRAVGLGDGGSAVQNRFASLRAFAGLDLQAIPNETTILNFRHMLEASDLAEDIFKHVITLFALSNLWMARKRLMEMQGQVRLQMA